MRLNIVSFSKCLLITVASLACMAGHAAERHRYECPARLVVGKLGHALKSAQVYDGPPEELASLEAWDKEPLAGTDVYLVCEYKATNNVVTIHAVGVRSCKMTDKPQAVFCE
jgi:hypothetical protein